MHCLKRAAINHLLFRFLCTKEQAVEKILKMRSIDETSENVFIFTAKYDINRTNIFVKFWIYILCSKEVLMQVRIIES